MRIAVAVLLCLSLALARLLGAHVHISHDGDRTPHHGHDVGALAVEFVTDADHAQAHDGHGEVDAVAADFAAKNGNTMALALIAVAIVLILQVTTGHAALVPAYRGPPFRRRPHLLPPSQAPPLAS